MIQNLIGLFQQQCFLLSLFADIFIVEFVLN
jgi:hypothetical protein